MARARAAWTRSFINGAKVLLAQLDPRSFSLMRALATAFVLLGLAAGLLTLESTALGADDATETVRLEPGDNFVGWVADPIAIAEIFEQIPEAALIYRWDAESRTYRYAIRDGSATLETLQPGMAANIRIDGRISVKWERPLTPAKGMVTLYSGENWVAWNGRDEWPLDQVARGIGSSLVSIEAEERGIVYQPGSSISEAIAPLNGESTLRRGDALRVTVNRDLRWLQPTGMMPNIVWVGEIPKNLKDEITTDIRSVIDFFAEEFGVESDFTESTILIWYDIEDAITYAESGKEPTFGYPPDQLRNELVSGGRTAQADASSLFMSACGYWPPDPQDCHGRTTHTLTHEMVHVIQWQLSTQQEFPVMPVWMIEGPADWATWQLPSDLRNHPTEIDRNSRLDETARTKATLQSTGHTYTDLAYRLGSLAAERLAERTNADAHFEFYRQLYPQAIGNERQWVKVTAWHEAFASAFGLSTADFYREFAAWRETLPEPRRWYDYNPDDATLTGTLHYSDGTPASGFRVEAIEFVDGVNYNFDRATIVNDAGNFSIDLAPNTMQRLRLNLNRCQLWLTDDDLVTSIPDVDQHRELDTRNLPKLDLTLPEDICENELRVTVLPLRGDDRWFEILLNSEDEDQWIRAEPDGSNTHIVFAPEPGEYRVRLYLDGCVLWYHENWLVSSTSSGQLLTLGAEPVSISVRIPDTLCVRQISGRVTGKDGSAIEGIQLVAAHDDALAFNDLTTDTDGTFVITVPDSRDYSLHFQWEDCYINYAEAGGTASWEDITLVTVADEDVTGIEFVVPSDPASLCR